MLHAIREATDAADYEAIGALIREYVGWMRERYSDDAWMVEGALAEQSFAEEQRRFAEKYSPPKGRAYLAERDGGPVGCIAYRTLEPGVCEMKRLYVASAAKGSGLGRALCERLIHDAARDGHRVMRLDTGKRMTEALALYRSLGFTERTPYLDYPEHLIPHLVFMERGL